MNNFFSKSRLRTFVVIVNIVGKIRTIERKVASICHFFFSLKAGISVPGMPISPCRPLIRIHTPFTLTARLDMREHTYVCITDSTVFARVDPDGFTVINSLGCGRHDLKYIFELSGRRHGEGRVLLITRCSCTIRPVNTRVSGYQGLMDLSVVIDSRRRITTTVGRRSGYYGLSALMKPRVSKSVTCDPRDKRALHVTDSRRADDVSVGENTRFRDRDAGLTPSSHRSSVYIAVYRSAV